MKSWTWKENMSSHRSLIWFAVLSICAWSTGCGSAPTDPDKVALPSAPVDKTDSNGFSHGITVIGDDTASDVASNLGQRGLSITQDPASIGTAEVVVMAVDATAGIRDVHRQLAEDLGKNRDARVVWLYTKMSQIDDQELMKLQQSEAQELLEQNGVARANVRFAVDTEQTTVDNDMLKGWTSVEEFLAK